VISGSDGFEQEEMEDFEQEAAEGSGEKGRTSTIERRFLPSGSTAVQNPLA
jgi:hypothetical protein